MEENYNLERFVEAQSYSYGSALQELRNGRKTSHWMWYIFPQLRGLGRTPTANYFGVDGSDEARAYLNHPTLNARLREVCAAILQLDTNDARIVFGGIDSLKLCSSMTLFDFVMPNDVFADVLNKFYNGRRDPLTLNLIAKESHRG